MQYGLRESSQERVAFYSKAMYYVSALCAALVVTQTGPYPYSAGIEDHWVISPAGIQRFSSGMFRNDYFVSNAQMPHWFFETLTGLSYKLQLIDQFYFGWWLATFAVAASATLIVIHSLRSPRPHTLAFVVFVLQVMGTRIAFGTSSFVLEQALPHAMAASLLFLLIAWRYFGRLKHSYFLLPLIPIVHVQIGAIAVVLVVLAGLIGFVSTRSIPRGDLVSVGLGIFTVFAGLIIRPIAGDPAQFSEICRVLIPHHCYAPSWSSNDIRVSGLLLVLALLGIVLVAKTTASNVFKIVVLAAPASVLAITLTLDRFFDGPIVDLVRGNNIYRFAVVLLPWIYLLPTLLSERQVRSSVWLFPTLVYSSLLVVFLIEPSTQSQFADDPTSAVFLIALVLFFSSPHFSRFVQGRHGLVSALTAAIALGALSLQLFAGNKDFSFPNIRFGVSTMNVDGVNFDRIGAEIAASSFEGAVVAGDPAEKWVRIASGRAYAVDCKFRPIGGGKPLVEFYKRLEPLGGYDAACLQRSFQTVGPDDLEKYAASTRADFLLFQAGDGRVGLLSERGWVNQASEGLTTQGFVLLRSPS